MPERVGAQRQCVSVAELLMEAEHENCASARLQASSASTRAVTGRSEAERLWVWNSFSSVTVKHIKGAFTRTVAQTGLFFLCI